MPMQFLRPQFPVIPHLQGQMIREISEAVTEAVFTRHRGGDHSSQPGNVASHGGAYTNL